MIWNIISIEADNAVKVIRHGHPVVKLYISEFIGQFLPPVINHVTCGIRNHSLFSDMPKKRYMPLSTYRHKIGLFLGVIVVC